MRHFARRLVATLALAGAVVAIPVAQNPKPQDPPQQQPPRIRVESTFVRVDVYPTRGDEPVLDLKEEDFEVFEDNAPQKVATFEHVVVRAGGPDADRVEVSSQRESLQAAANPRNRVFVIFLDAPHVKFESGAQIREPLIRLMTRILGPDDLVGIMLPGMATSQIVLGRKTQVIEDSLRTAWPWATKQTIQYDEREQAYIDCYPALPGERGLVSALAAEMIARKRERATLEALEDLVRYLRSIRDERKAIIPVSEGWVLFTENLNLMKPRQEGDVPTVDPVGVGPTGKLTTKDPRRVDIGSLSKNECDTDRLRLATMDNRQFFRDMLGEANAANASFYPVDPRGLQFGDIPITQATSLQSTMGILKEQVSNLRTMAENTDGLAVVESNNLEKGLRRISDDLTSYYLLGYYSTNTKLDGRYRALKVRVKRPGVSVRARNGYRAATDAEVTAARTAADAPVPESTRVLNSALDKLGRARPDARFTINAVPSAKGTLWISGEVQPVTGRPDDFTQGGTADIDARVGTTAVTARVTLKPGERTFLTSVTLPPGATGEVAVRARLSPTDAATVPFADAVRVDAGPTTHQPLVYRRGVTTGNRLVPAANFLFSRTERVRFEIPADADVTATAARLLDRTGQPLQAPVTLGERTDAASGQRWITADLTLGALAAGDFAIEIELRTGAGAARVVTALRVSR